MAAMLSSCDTQDDGTCPPRRSSAITIELSRTIPKPATDLGWAPVDSPRVLRQVRPEFGIWRREPTHQLGQIASSERRASNTDRPQFSDQAPMSVAVKYLAGVLESPSTRHGSSSPPASPKWSWPMRNPLL